MSIQIFCFCIDHHNELFFIPRGSQSAGMAHLDPGVTLPRNGGSICSGMRGQFVPESPADYENFFGKQKETILSSEFYFTYVITFKDQKVKVQSLDIEYKISKYIISTVTGGGYYGFEEVSIFSMFPIAQGSPIEWKGKINLIKETERGIMLSIARMVNYINDYEKDYGF